MCSIGVGTGSARSCSTSLSTACASACSAEPMVSSCDFRAATQPGKSGNQAPKVPLGPRSSPNSPRAPSQFRVLSECWDRRGRRDLGSVRYGRCDLRQCRLHAAGRELARPPRRGRASDPADDVGPWLWCKVAGTDRACRRRVSASVAVTTISRAGFQRLRSFPAPEVGTKCPNARWPKPSPTAVGRRSRACIATGRMSDACCAAPDGASPPSDGIMLQSCVFEARCQQPKSVKCI
jgi:hypothetical protein